MGNILDQIDTFTSQFQGKHLYFVGTHEEICDFKHDVDIARQLVFHPYEMKTINGIDFSFMTDCEYKQLKDKPPVNEVFFLEG